MGLFSKVKSAAKKASSTGRRGVSTVTRSTYRHAVRPVTRETYRSVIRPGARRVSSTARSAMPRWKRSAMPRWKGPSLRQVGRAAWRSNPVRGFTGVISTLRRQTQKARKQQRRRGNRRR